MKRNILSLILLIAALLSIPGCVPLDVTPYDRDTDANFWNRPEAAIEAVNACYANINSADEILYGDALTDNAYTKIPSGFVQSLGNGSASAADSYAKSEWNSRYYGIRNCNMLLNNIDKVPKLSDVLKKQYIGEVTVIRANHYFELYSKFGDVPYFNDVISLEKSRTISREAKSEVVKEIINELDKVIKGQFLPEQYSDAKDKGRITIWAAKALKARILLFEGRFAEVAQITRDIMDNGHFTLFPDYSGLFTVENENNSEVIWDLQYITVNREHQVQYQFLPPSLGGYCQLAPLQELVDDYITMDGHTIKDAPSGSYNPDKPFDNRDPRLAASIVYSGNFYQMADGSKHTVNCDKGAAPDGYGASSSSSPTGYYIRKYWDKDYRANLMSGLNIILIRYADVLLMNAEALVEQNKLDESAWNKTIKLLRQRAGFTLPSAVNFPGTSADLRGIIRRERRCELAFEGLRQKDLFRWHWGEKVLNGWCHGLRTNDATGTDNGFIRIENRKFNPAKQYLWPIPQDERDLNHHLTQNPNW